MLSEISPSCSQTLATSLPPAVIALTIFFRYLFLLYFPRTSRKFTLSYFRPLLSIEEAEALNHDGSPSIGKSPPRTETRASLWSTFAMTLVAFVEAAFWMMTFIGAFTRHTNLCTTSGSALMTFSWLLATFKPVLVRKITPLYDILLLYISFMVVEIIHFGNLLVRWSFADPSTLPSRGLIVLHIINLSAILLLVQLTLSKPIAPAYGLPSKNRVPSAPEDNASLWSWLTYGWLNPLIKQATYTEVNEDDIPMLSITNQAKPVFLKFNTFKQKSLPWQLFKANSLDLL